MAELKFRDGERIVPDYFPQLMAGLPLHKLTYDQAVNAMNAQQVQGVVDRAFDRVIDRHFEDRRR